MRVKWKRMICGRPALIVIQMQRGEKAVMFRQMAKHARLMTTSRYIERTAPHRKSWVNALKPMRATTPGLSSMGGGSLLKPAGKQVLYQIGNLYRVIVPAGRMRQARPQQAKVYKEVNNDLTAAVLRTI